MARAARLSFVFFLALTGAAHAGVAVGAGAGPVIAGSGELLYTRSAGLSTDLYKVGSGGRKEKITTLFTDDDTSQDDGGGSNSFTLGGLGASPQRTAARVDSLFNKVRGFTHNIVSAPAGGRSFTAVASVTGDEFNGPYCGPDIGGFDVTGDAVAFARTASICPFGPSTPESVVVKDFATGGPATVIAEAPSVSSVRTAGRFVAWNQRSPSEIVVFDRAAAAVAYKVPVDIAGLDVQDDGQTVATLADGSLAWFSPAEPVAHPVGVSGTRVHLNADRVAYLAGDDNRSELRVSSITGGGAGAYASFSGKRDLVQFDFDGHAVAWRNPRCTADTLESATTAPASPANAAAPRCTLSFPKRTLTLSKRRLRVPVKCPQGCRVSILVSSKLVSRSTERDLRPGTSAVVFGVSKSRLRRLAGRHTVGAKIEAGVEDPGTVEPRGYTARLKIRF